jgi:hypothetical protein
VGQRQHVAWQDKPAPRNFDRPMSGFFYHDYLPSPQSLSWYHGYFRLSNFFLKKFLARKTEISYNPTNSEQQFPAGSARKRLFKRSAMTHYGYNNRQIRL